MYSLLARVQERMSFLQQLLQQHDLTPSPVPGARLGSAIFRNWMKKKSKLDLELLMHDFVSAKKMDLEGFILPVGLPACPF